MSVGWVVMRCPPAKEHELAKDCALISIEAYVPVSRFYRSKSRYAPDRVAYGELIAPRLVFAHAGYAKIEKLRKLRLCNEILLGDDDTPYVIPDDRMQGFKLAVEAANSVADRMEQHARDQADKAAKTSWRKLGEDVYNRLKAMVGLAKSP